MSVEEQVGQCAVPDSSQASLLVRELRASDDPARQVAAIDAIREFVAGYQTAKQNELSEANGLVELVQLLRVVEGGVAAASARAIADAVSANSECIDCIIAAGAFPALARLLSADDASAQWAAYAFWCSILNVRHAAAIRTAGGLPSLLRLLKTTDNEKTLEAVTATLLCISNYDAMHLALVQSNVLEPLARVVKATSNPDIQFTCCLVVMQAYASQVCLKISHWESWLRPHRLLMTFCFSPP